MGGKKVKKGYDVRNDLKKMKLKMDRASPRSPQMERNC